MASEFALSTLAALCLALGSVTDLSASAAGEDGANASRHRGIELGSGGRLVSHGTASTVAAKAATDSVYIYGGPGTLEGKFETAGGEPSRGGWIGVDETDIPLRWQVSEFNASTLGGHGTGNLAAWCGRNAEVEPNWAAAPGYGDRWDEELIFERSVSDPFAGQTVDLDFFFHHDIDAQSFDVFRVEYDLAGVWTEVFETTGSDRNLAGEFEAPGVPYSNQLGVVPIVYAGGDYSTNGTIRIRLRFTSGFKGSDEDGLFDGMGAVQVDDIAVDCSEGVFVEDFEAGFTHWRPVKHPFAGDFFGVYRRVTDLDPCASNTSGVAGFLDMGQDVNNSASAALIPGFPTSTGGQTSANWFYGVPGGWVVNYQGGLGGGFLSLDNHMVSPEIEWDLPGSEDDGADYVGLRLHFDVWTHQPLLNGLFELWAVRSSTDGVRWSPWIHDNGSLDSGGFPYWRNRSFVVTEYIEPGATRVQIRLGVVDFAALFGWPGNDATPSPLYDNVGLQKFRLGGPVLSTRTNDLAQDGFPVSGSIDVSTLAARDALDIPFDMARDVSTGNLIATGDSILVEEHARIPGTTVTDRRMIWVLDKNPLFEDAIRSVPARPKDENVDASDPLRWTGEVVGEQSFTSAGALVSDHFFYDLPDLDFLYPGDVLRYYIQATDSDGRVSTLPEDIGGFMDGGGYDRTYRVYGLPSISDPTGAQPPKLVVNDFGRRGGENELTFVMRELGLTEGIDYDVYTVQRPDRGLSNGIGSAGGHGANAAQLEGYDTILYFSGNLTSFLLGDGGYYDKGDDLGTLEDWHGLAGNRNMVYFGDNIGSSVEGSGAAGAVYVQTIMHVAVTDAYVGDDIGDQTAPVVLALDPSFNQSFSVYGGCPGIHRFDNIQPLTPAFRGHGFEVAGAPGTTYENIAASVIYDRLVDGDRKVDITFPFGFLYVYNVAEPGGVGTSARTELLREVFDYFGVPSGGSATPVVPSARAASLSVHPNPFNPRTVIRLSVPAAGDGRVDVFDLRGRRVRVLHAGPFTSAAEHTWTWSGRDDAGASVSSGVYVVRAEGPGFELKKKIAILK